MLLFFYPVYSIEKKITTSDGVILHVTIEGQGIPCLYIHGGPGSGSYWAQKFTGDIFEPKFRMIYLDQRGCCRSSSPENNNYSMERMIMDFEEVRLALGIKHWLIMGHSFGGLLQMKYAMKHPGVLKGIIMINCTLNWKESFEKGFCPKASLLLSMSDSTLCSDESTLFVDRFGTLIQQLNEKNLMWKLGYQSFENFQRMSETFGEIPDWNWGSEESIVYTPDYWENFKPYTREIDLPVLFFYGKTDWNIGPEHFQGVNFPNMLLWESNVGHMPFLENREELNKALDTYKSTFNF